MTYRMLKIRDPRSPGVYWYEIEGRTAEGRVETVAVCDTREEAVSVLRAMRDFVAAQ